MTLIRPLIIALALSTPVFAKAYHESAFTHGPYLSDIRTDPFSLKTNYQTAQVGEVAFTDARSASAAASTGAASIDNYGASAGAETDFTDEMQINAPGRTGQTGTITFRLSTAFVISGWSGGSANANGRVYAQIGATTLQEEYNTFFGGGWFGFPGYDIDDPFVAPTQITAPFTFGTSFRVYLEAYSSSVSQTENAGGTFPQFCSSGVAIGFNGIASIKDATGNEISGDATFGASSGYNYAIAATLPSTLVIVAGDANLDYAVNFDDLLILAQNYGTGTDKIWGQGDFNGDHTVSFDDLLALAQHYGSGAGSSMPVLSDVPANVTADWALAQSLVPEPATLTALAGLGAPALHRRRAFSPRSSATPARV